MLTIHHLGTSQSERIVWLCEELDLPYALVRYARDPVTHQAPPEYRALHSFGTAPVITDDDLVLGESGAIVEYICQRLAGGRLTVGPESPDFAQYLHWFHFANASFLPSLMMKMLAPKDPAASNGAPADDRNERALNMIEARLGEADFFAGDAFTAADIMMCLTLYFTTRDPSPYPNITAYLRRMAERPAFRRASAKAEPDRPARSW